MGIRIKFSAATTDIAPIVNRFKGLISLIDHPKPMWESVAKRMVEQTIKRFYTQTSPKGEPWKPSGLKAWERKSSAKGLEKGNKSGLFRVKKTGYTLIQTGALVRSIKWVASDTGAEWGTKIFWAGVHNNGLPRTIKAKNGEWLRFKTERGWVRVKEVRTVQRQFLGISKEDRLIARKMIMDYLEVWFGVADAIKLEDAYIKSL